jgi:hypothetical protein
VETHSLGEVQVLWILIHLVGYRYYGYSFTWWGTGTVDTHLVEYRYCGYSFTWWSTGTVDTHSLGVVPVLWILIHVVRYRYCGY